MTPLERIAALETAVVFLREQLDRLVFFTGEMLFAMIAGLAAIAYLAFKKSDRGD